MRALLVFFISMVAAGQQLNWQMLVDDGRRAEQDARHGDAATAYLSAITRMEAAGVLDDRLAQARYLLALAYVSAGRYAEAEQQCKLALTIQRDDPEILLALATANRFVGHNAEAERLGRRAVGIAERSGVPVPGLFYNSFALILLAGGRRAEAEKVAKRALASFNESGNRVAFAEALSTLGNIYAGGGHFSESEACHRRALDVLEQEGARSRSVLMQTRMSLASLYLAMGDTSRAELEARQAIQDRQAPMDPDWANTALVLAQTLMKERRFGEAEQYFLSALAILKKQRGDLNVNYGLGELAYARLLRQTGRTQEAKNIEARAKAVLPRRETVDVSDLRQK